ncbi:hypothetical protein AB1Y20_005121 [Prymnesium parvum]|uniref:CENP-V/GFA domain-containing protein n=1 Tax=Prymnesium parvum TaxID=97485 RepID=A0AB34J5P2_PRYPA|mmetsp:Transcript_66011/g.116932  ORF Transcript_66011/g.116932 Transcript_66011/m.116932 type:complete len:201 (-) Transcript_66011:121-723(-)
MDPRASHWAAAPLLADEPPAAGAPIAGGGVLNPAATRLAWDFDVRTSVTPSASTPPVMPSGGEVSHRGGCHCGRVRFEARAPAELVVWDCTCSDCRMRRNLHFVLPAHKLKILDSPSGEDGAAALAEYRWGTGVARHLFCARCGICPFYRPRSNPDGWAVTFQCLDPGTVSAVEVRTFDGQHWEEFIEGDGASIRAFSNA